MWSDEASRFSLRLCVFKAVEVGVNQSVCRKTDGQDLGGKVLTSCKVVFKPA